MSFRKVNNIDDCAGEYSDMMNDFTFEDNPIDLHRVYFDKDIYCIDICGAHELHKQYQLKVPQEMDEIYRDICMSIPDEEYIESEIILKIPNLDYNKLDEVDRVFCNIKAVRGKTLIPNCTTYRKVIMLKNGQKNAVYYSITHVNTDKHTHYANHIREQCRGNEQLKKIGMDLSNDDEIIYLDGAFTLFPEKLRNIHTDKEYERYKKLNPDYDPTIYKMAVRAALTQTLLLTKKLGYKYMVLDPAPGFHPNTFRYNDDEKLRGLVGLYKDMGFHEITCNFPISTDMESQLLSKPINSPVMVADIDKLLKNKIWQELYNVPTYQQGDNMKDMYNEQEFDDLIKNVGKLQGGAYMKKYYKYKNKLSTTNNK